MGGAPFGEFPLGFGVALLGRALAVAAGASGNGGGGVHGALPL
ncbi:hypothetical protein [Sphingobium sp. D43FB]|nr:hypothetical protein [Sphingobium sp. D43FB]